MKITIADFDGIYPALDHKKVGKPHVLGGKNYLVDLDGPRSAFGYYDALKVFDPKHLPQSFHIGSSHFYFARDPNETVLQISTLDWPSRQTVPVAEFISSDLTRPKLSYPWTHAYVGTYHYFANRTWGVLQYDSVNLNWKDVTSTLGISNVFFICESDGRLCCVAEGLVSWSAIDDGMDNTPSTTTGAGSQALTLIGNLENNTDYLGILKISKGFLTFTSKGVLRSEIIDSVIPFRHLPGETKHVPLNPWCITKITDADIVTLTRFGLFTTQTGFQFEEFQPIHNEYLKTTEISQVQSIRSGYFRLHYSESRDELYVSIAQSELLGQYTRAWVLYVKKNQWGHFDHVHRGFIEIDEFADGDNFDQGYVDVNGHPRLLNQTSITLLIQAQNTLGSYVQETQQKSTFQVEGVWRMSTTVRFGGFSYEPFPEVAGFYELNGASATFKTENTGPAAVVVEGAVNLMPTNVTVDSGLVKIGPTAQEPLEQSVDSWIEVGLFRLSDEEANDQLTFISNVAISCLDATESAAFIFDDWLNDYEADVFEDWLTATGSEDWGASVTTGSIYTQQIRGSLDGYETFEDQLQDLEEVLIDGKTKFCTCQSAGIFQSVILTADETGQSFHLKTLELNGSLAGRL